MEWKGPGKAQESVFSKQAFSIHHRLIKLMKHLCMRWEPRIGQPIPGEHYVWNGRMHFRKHRHELGGC